MTPASVPRRRAVDAPAPRTPAPAPAADHGADAVPRAELVAVGSSEAYARLLGASGVPIVVEFTARWCGPCRHTRLLLEQAAARHHDTAVFAYVDIDETPDLAETLGVKNLPTVVFYHNGRVVGSLEGHDPARLHELLRQLVVPRPGAGLRVGR